MIEVVEGSISTDGVFGRLSTEGCGSVVAHVGVVKPMVDDQKTRGMKLVRDGDLEGELAQVEAALRERWPLTDVLIIRRLGELTVGDVIMVAAISAPKKNDAIAACDEAVNLLKKKRGMKKEELYV